MEARDAAEGTCGHAALFNLKMMEMN